jgi:hypothetical protein
MPHGRQVGVAGIWSQTLVPVHGPAGPLQQGSFAPPQDTQVYDWSVFE